ncbi:aminotransferase class I/II-fold pyridoxal phosphate-dependent enzyme [Halorubrum ezzemoulense]|uniref:Aminotransferase class I/II-fold pyridoxal phosphate-dependent enzyme n=1 Tax=Halorubrum ezzemoulense TaxID=337243 RepID=A0ABT4Z4B3_HALEZ|nr:aminotransferase class I/II-fold pyridoxal phosphate-dependent enzyme [Halorubrum ezzemoulense]MDB2245102.1 aminotransferase class I/II-fold pyridoxal phosphate-dependent enzyme [Halorubrum ezzemoulense]MDB2252588.1 aminotransferase class I/II-fold pyridoxal phosphate-dependent enzyme [Halorubrum ezzemoulense]MDB2278140.1 aminotransferase class I/II-fold pyridoxal phosphate-dependent enzyme [Halorubrum ezzemoulense]MDB2284814.1 aminotransferase class I/II-fold pyridoxal phosphate-dependent e
MNRERAAALGREPHGSTDDPDLLDFSANTNPAVPAGVERVYCAAFETARTYPPEPPEAFRAAAADYVGCEPENVVPTPGGLAAIRTAIALAVDPGDSALLPAPSFGEYAREVRLRGGDPSFVDAERVLDADPRGHALAVVCTPNNPTGAGYDREALLAFAERCRAADTVLLVDEAFLGFTERESLAGTDGVVVARALTKLFGLPGIRAGFAVATGDLGAAMRGARRAWNVSAPALATGEYCLRQTAFVRETRDRVRRERGRLRTGLGERYDVAPSEAPFLLVDVGDRDVDRVVARARERGVAVRDARTFRGLDSHVRVAVRHPAENDRLLAALGVDGEEDDDEADAETGDGGGGGDADV